MTLRITNMISSILRSMNEMYSKLTKHGYSKPEVHGHVTVSAAWGT
jgi:hypothetical protein